MKLRQKSIALIVAAALGGLLVACGGGSQTASTTTTPIAASAAAISPQIFVTDAAAKDYTKVWVDLDRITAVTSTGREITLWDTADLLHVNLAELQQLALWLNTPRIATDATYTGLRIYVGPSVAVEKADASAIAGTFANTVATVSGSTNRRIDLTLPTNWTSYASLLLDFDLASSTFDESQNTFTPVVTLTTLADRPDIGTSRVAQLKGTVTAISATGFTVTTSQGTAVTLTNASSLVISDERASPTGAISVDETVEVLATPGATSADPMSALTVHILDATSAIAWVQGTIKTVSANSSTTTLTLDVAQSSISTTLPSPLTITLPTSSLVYIRGSGGVLMAGAKVQLRGHWATATSVFTAESVEVDGARNNCGGRAHRHLCNGSSANAGAGSSSAAGAAGLTMIEGQVTAVSGTSATVTVLKSASATSSLVGQNLTVDFTNARGKGGAADCVTSGAVVDFAGQLAGTTLTAAVWKLDTPATGSTCYGNWRKHQ